MSQTAAIELYDHEVEKILGIQQRLNDMVKATRLNYNDFERQLRDEFAAIGFTVNVNWYTFSVGGVEQEGAMPEVTITGRTDAKFTFDPDRQVHEVTSDILGLGDAGVIKTSKETLKRFSDGHGHGY